MSLQPPGNWSLRLRLPTAASGSNNPLTASGTATSEGMLSLSTDKASLVVTGYDAAPGSSGSIVTTLTTAVPREVGIIDSSGNINTSTTTTSYSAGNPRSVAADGNNLWMSGSNTGLVSTTIGDSGPGTVVSTTSTNTRVIQIDNGQLYYSTGVTGAGGIYSVGSGEPLGSGTTATQLPGVSTTSPYGFFFARVGTGATFNGYDTLYVADDATGIEKWTYNGATSTWQAAGTVTAASVRGLTGTVNGTSVTLYGTTGGSTSSGGGSIYAFTDASGAGGTVSGSATTIATAATGEAFRGIAFAPSLPASTISVTSGDEAYTGSAYLPSVSDTGSGAAPTYTYYLGASATGTPLGAAPKNVGQYTVVASVASDGSFAAAASTPVTFQITAIPLSVMATGVDKSYDGTTAGTANYSLSGVLPVDAGNVTATGTATFASATVGTGIAVGTTGISLGGSAGGNYTLSNTTSNTSANITLATPIVRVSDAGGTFNGSAFPATASVAGVVNGVDTTPAATLESVGTTLTYYVGSDTSGTNLGSSAPTAIGTYTVVASFAGSQDYENATSSPLTFNITLEPTVTITTSNSIAYSGNAYVPAATVVGADGQDGRGY